MGLLDVLWHLLNFIAPGLGVGALACGMAWLLWRKGLAAVPVRFTTLLGWACAAGVAAVVLGLLLFERDGRMATYVLLMACVAVALWWRGLRHIPYHLPQPEAASVAPVASRQFAPSRQQVSQFPRDAG